ncbi:MAG: 3,4-dihydroxy-2-butanone-4-phosphate synthase [Phycisphaeraceae bacterium]
MHPIPEILTDLRAGKMIVLIDDETRENEGDLVCAAQFITPELVNFMVREARGLLCVPMPGQWCDRLDLRPQTAINTASRGTAFTVTVDAHERFGVTTGVSAKDRSATIRVLADPSTLPGDLLRPGHINPLRARDGGVLVRAGQTEGSVDLCRLAGLSPVSVIIEIMNEDGSMARLPDLKTMCEKHKLKMCSVAEVIQYRLQREKLIERIETAPFENEFGQFTLIAYSSVVDSLPHVALVCGDVGRLDATGQPVDVQDPVLVRMHSQNLLGDVFHDCRDPSSKTLAASMQMIQQAGQGAVVYLRHEMMGTGLLRRLQTLRIPEDSRMVPLAASHGQDAYGIGSQILRDLGVRKLRLLTNHPFHPTALSGFGLEITEFVKVNE